MKKLPKWLRHVIITVLAFLVVGMFASRELSNQNDRSQAMTYVMKSFLKLTGF